jgi:hypothetical protein
LTGCKNGQKDDEKELENWHALHLEIWKISGAKTGVKKLP